MGFAGKSWSRRGLLLAAGAGVLAGCAPGTDLITDDPETTSAQTTSQTQTTSTQAGSTTSAPGTGTAQAAKTTQTQTPTPAGPGWKFERQANPNRTIVRDKNNKVLATFTDGARSVAFEGPSRTFAEPATTNAKVTHTTWVRIAPQAWKSGDENAAWFAEWFSARLTDKSPDLFGVAWQYFAGAPEVKDAKGVRIAGDSAFGPLPVDGELRDDGTDFLDYLGIPYKFVDKAEVVQPQPDRYGMLDCSGFVRLVFGYRFGLPLLGTSARSNNGIPRRAWAILDNGPGVELIKNTGQPPADLSMLQPGDTVFFEVDSADPHLDHMGIYLGVDNKGQRRFISSRSKANGPTMGDLSGDSTFGVTGMYSSGLRGARRL